MMKWVQTAHSLKHFLQHYYKLKSIENYRMKTDSLNEKGVVSISLNDKYQIKRKRDEKKITSLLPLLRIGDKLILEEAAKALITSGVYFETAWSLSLTGDIFQVTSSTTSSWLCFTNCTPRFT